MLFVSLYHSITIWFVLFFCIMPTPHDDGRHWLGSWHDELTFGRWMFGLGDSLGGSPSLSRWNVWEWASSFVFRFSKIWSELVTFSHGSCQRQEWLRRQNISTVLAQRQWTPAVAITLIVDPMRPGEIDRCCQVLHHQQILALHIKKAIDYICTPARWIPIICDMYTLITHISA